MILALAGPFDFQTPDVTLLVSAKMDIYRAAGFPDGSDGVAPATYVFPARNRQILIFSRVTGKWTCGHGVAPFGPDGTKECPAVNIANPVGCFAAYSATDFQGAMVGMFLADALPASAPRASRFYVNDKSEGGMSTGLSSSRQRVAIYGPLIGQVFFIGDGLSGTNSGGNQFFAVPDAATHLYLGYVDSCGPSSAVPGCYSGNQGTLTATFRLVAR